MTVEKLQQTAPIMLLLLILLSGCATGEHASDSQEARAGSEQQRERESGLEEGDLDEETQRLFVLNRSRLQDQFTNQTHSPLEDHFEPIVEEQSDPYQGFRIQILSTRDVSLADTTQAEFENWALDHFEDYVPHSYIHYRQPYYRVRIGDFHDRERAIEMSRLVQMRYPEAWIVYDRVVPERVAADTTRFQLRSPDELQRIPVQYVPDPAEDAAESNPD